MGARVSLLTASVKREYAVSNVRRGTKDYNRLVTKMSLVSLSIHFIMWRHLLFDVTVISLGPHFLPRMSGSRITGHYHVRANWHAWGGAVLATCLFFS